VSGVLRVESVSRDQLGPVDAHLSALSGHAVTLSLHVPEVRAAGATRREPMVVRAQLAARLLEH